MPEMIRAVGPSISANALVNTDCQQQWCKYSVKHLTYFIQVRPSWWKFIQLLLLMFMMMMVMKKTIMTVGLLLMISIKMNKHILHKKADTKHDNDNDQYCLHMTFFVCVPEYLTYYYICTMPTMGKPQHMEETHESVTVWIKLSNILAHLKLREWTNS